MITFSPSLNSKNFNNWTIFIRFIPQEMKVYVYSSGWWIQCDEHLVEVLNALKSIWATYVMRSNCKPKCDVLYVIILLYFFVYIKLLYVFDFVYGHV